VNRVNQAQSLPLSGVDVVLVEDDDDARELLKLFLEMSGAQVRCAAEARAGLTELQQLVPDVLISDIGLPGEDGYSLMRKCRSHESSSLRTMPAIAVTAFTRPEDVQKSLAAGFDEHLGKPLDVARLLASIARLTAHT
jgi:CheY-like chemotaxis protein